MHKILTLSLSIIFSSSSSLLLFITFVRTTQQRTADSFKTIDCEKKTKQAREMNVSRRMLFVLMTILIIVLVNPIQSMTHDEHSDKLSARQKRWTFNTWRLHGRRQLSKIPLNENPQYEMFIDDEPIAEHPFEFFRKSNH